MKDDDDQEWIKGMRDLQSLYAEWREGAQKTREFVRDGFLGTDTEMLNKKIDNLEDSINTISTMISAKLGDRPPEK